MALYKEWLVYLGRAIQQSGAKNPIYMLGDQVSSCSYPYAVKTLKRAGLLRNPNVEPVPCKSSSQCVSVKTIFEMLGLNVYHDVDLNGRAEITLDLSRPLPSSLHGVASSVVDIGTVEHVFDLAQAFTNIVDLLCDQGTVIHLSPVGWYNHGFVNFNPLLFKEFYGQNGFTIEQHGLIVQPFEGLPRTAIGLISSSMRYSDLGFSSPTSSCATIGGSSQNSAKRLA